MRRTRGLTLLTVVCCPAILWAGDDVTIEKEIQKILAAKYSYESSEGPGVAKGYEELFRRIGPAGIRELKKHKNPGVALRAAWEEVRLTVPENELFGVPVHAGALERFLDVAKERLPALIPDWWQKALLSAQSHRRDNIYFPFTDKTYKEAGAGFRAKPGVTVAKQGTEFSITIGEELLLLPVAVVEESKSRHQLSAAIAGNRAFIAFHRNLALGYSVCCIDRKDKFRWKNDVWADGGFVIYTGKHSHSVSIVPAKEQVLVFGCSTGGSLYVEAFNAEDGAVLYRFCTRY